MVSISTASPGRATWIVLRSSRPLLSGSAASSSSVYELHRRLGGRHLPYHLNIIDGAEHQPYATARDNVVIAISTPILSLRMAALPVSGTQQRYAA